MTVLIIGCDKLDDSQTSSNSALEPRKQSIQPLSTSASSSSPRAKKATRAGRTESEQALRKFASDFENLSGQNRGPDTLAKQRDLALAALPKIGGGDELLKFFDYLTERGAGDLRKELVEKHVLDALALRFDTLPSGLGEAVRGIADEEKVRPLLRLAICCASVEGFAGDL